MVHEISMLHKFPTPLLSSCCKCSLLWTVIVQRDFLAGENYHPEIIENGYRVHMKLVIRSIGARDYDHYKCISRNTIGETEGTINVYRKKLISFLIVVYFVLVNVKGSPGHPFCHYFRDIKTACV